MFNRESTKKITDSTRFLEWHGYHNGKHYNRSNPIYQKVKCGTCKKIKPLDLMYGRDSVNDVWICNECILNRGKEREKKQYYFFDCVLETINECIRDKKRVITVKLIRRLRNIESSNMSMINFIWRSLRFLEENGFIERYNNTFPKQYRLPLTEIKIEKVIE